MKASFSTNPSSLGRINSKPVSLWSKATKLLNTVVGDAIDFLSASPEIRIRKMVDSNGNTYWRVYDPATEQYNWFETENEVRTWIEGRYSR